MKQAKLVSLCFLVILVLLICFVCFILLNNEVVFAETVRSNISEEDGMIDELPLELKSKELIRLVNDVNYNVKDDTTIIQLKCNSKEEISNIKFSNALNDIKYEILKDNYINISIKREFDYNYSEIGFSIFSKDKVLIETSLFIFENSQGVFYSIESLNKAKEEWINYVASNGLVSAETEKSCRNLILNKSLNSNDDLFKYSDSIYKNSLKSRGNKDTYVSGKIKWTTNNNYLIPIRQVLVEVYDKNLDMFGDTLLGSTTSDNYGNYSITFQNNDSLFDNHGSDIYIKIYAGDGNIEVRGAFPSADHQESRYSVNTRYKVINDVTTGSSNTIDETITMIDSGDEFRERACQAIQISQAAIVARAFASSQLGHLPGSIDIWYPWSSSGCYYDAFSDAIYIPYLKGDDSEYYTYESWDVIMHEYGHFIQYQIGLQSIWADIQSFIENGDTSNHSSNVNDANRYGKSVGIKLAWAESWPTVFGLIAQKEYQYSISNISTVRDSSYTSYNGLDYDIETTNVRLGEACERSIMAVLWDLYDSHNDENDDIVLSASNWWNITTISGTYTFSDFIQNFYAEYPEYIDALGQNLSYYKMCAYDLSISLGTTPSACPSISWNNYSGWDNHPLTTAVIAYDTTETLSCILGLSITSTVSGNLDQAQWNQVLAWEGATFKVKMYSAQGDNPETGNYISQTYVFSKPQFVVTEKQDNTYEIIGTYCTLSGNTSIPTNYFGKNITSIASYAFQNQTYLTTISMSSSVASIGAYAFNGCTSLATVYMSSASITRIEDYTFNNCPISSLSWPSSNITYIGKNAFYGNKLLRILLKSTTAYIGQNAFGSAEYLTIYSENNNTGWDSNWNSANRPFIFGCTYDNSNSYVVSFEKTAINPGTSYSGTINNPVRSGYTFSAWYTTSDFSGASYSTIDSAPIGMLYSKWNSNSSSSCITTGSLITLADGTQTVVENLTGNEQLLVWDMLNGTFTSAPILFMDVDPTTTYEVIILTFSDGTIVNVIDEHAFFDTTLNKYVFLRDDAAQYIGHYFTKQILDENNNMIQTNAQLIDVTIAEQITTAYSPVTYGHLCYYVNGMLSMPGNTESFINIFDVNPTTMSYDQTAMAQDIATYGLYTYEEFNNIIPLSQIVFDACNGQYLKVAIRKGITTLEEIQALLDRYSVFFE